MRNRYKKKQGTNFQPKYYGTKDCEDFTDYKKISKTF